LNDVESLFNDLNISLFNHIIDSKESKKKKFISILSKISDEKKAKTNKRLSEHQFHLKDAQEKANLFDYLLFRAIMEQTNSMSFVFGKPHQYHVEGETAIRLGKEALETFDKSAFLRPTRIGPISLIG